MGQTGLVRGTGPHRAGRCAAAAHAPRCRLV